MEKKNTGFFTTLKKEVIRGLSPSRSRPKRTTAKTTLPPPPPHPLRQNTTSTTNIPSILIRARHRNTVSNHHDDPPTVASACTSTDPDGLGGRYSGGVLRNAVEVLAPLMEGPMGEDAEENRARIERKEGWGRWMKGQLSRGTSSSSEIFNAVGLENAAHKRSDLRLLLGVMGAPLSPVGVFSLPDLLPRLCIKDTPIECSFAQYILQQYLAATGGQKLQKSFKNAYAMGKVKMVVSGYETANKAINNCTTSSSRVAESGGFVLWQMNPDMWYIELSVGGNKVHAGCNGKLVWRHTPWLGAHAAKGPVRPLRRALQGLDPRTTAGMFGNSRCIGEKKVNGVECFVLKLTSDPQNLKARSEGPAEIIRHVMFGYFSQRTGVLVQLEDSHLTRIQANNCGDAVYWETTINSFLDDYRPVEGMMIAHSGRSVVTLFKFGEMAMSHSKTRMEESWCIEEVAYNVAGLSVDCFIPPADIIRSKSISSTLTGLTAPTPPSDLDGFQKKHAPPQPPHSNRSRVAAITHQNHGNTVDNVVWRVEI